MPGSSIPPKQGATARFKRSKSAGAQARDLVDQPECLQTLVAVTHCSRNSHGLFVNRTVQDFFVLAELNDITAEFGSVDRDDYWLTEIKGGAEVTYES